MALPVSEPRDTVLVVDDSPETLSLVTDILEAAGMTALVATDGSQALSIVSRRLPDLVLLDAVMPGKDGFQVCRQLKRLPNASSLPVVFMTGLSEPEHVVMGFEAGGVDYVTKPIAPDVLVARLRAHLSAMRRMLGAHAALDLTGRHLLAADRSGSIQWATPEARRLVAQIAPEPPDASILPPALAEWIDEAVVGASLRLEFGVGEELHIALVDTGEAQHVLLRLTVGQTESPEARLQKRFHLTAREAEVLLWIARGKPNRDIADILGLSPRTVNKHLEQVFAKLGVENRTAAAARALECLASSI